MEEEIRKRIENGTFTDDDIVSLMCWQLSLPGEEMDCALIDECDRYLSRDAAGLSDADRERMWRQMLVRISGAETHRRAAPPARHRRTSRRRAAVLLLLALLALAVGGVAYTVRRGVLNFTEDFGFAPMVSQEGAERLVTSGSLAHIELERTIIDVREAVYDGAELRIVYSLTDRSGELHLAATVANGYEMPGYDAGETQICDYVLVNGQNVDFDQAWEVPGDAPGQMLYYLQTNLSAWRAELADAKTLDIRLPMLQNGEQVAFSIPAVVPAGMIRHASVAETLEGPSARVLQSNLSPISGYIELLLEGVDETAYFGEFSNHYAVYGADGSELTWAYSVGILGFDEAGTHLGITITPPAEEWPEKMTLSIERSPINAEYQIQIEP